MDETFYAPVGTPLGPGFIARNARGIVMLEVNVPERVFARRVSDRFGHAVRTDLPAAERRRIEIAIARGDGSGVDWTSLPAFQRRVLRATARIPAGRVLSYGDLAERVSAPRAARAVGTALARNPIPLLVPCHRVVRADGSFGNYGLGGTDVKRRLLTDEAAVTSVTLVAPRILTTGGGAPVTEDLVS